MTRRTAIPQAEPGAPMTASPSSVLVTPDKVSASMVARGLLREDPSRPGKSCCITPKGLRALADEMEAGRVADGLEDMRRDVEATRARMAAKGHKWIGDGP